MKDSPRHLAFSIGLLLLLNLFMGVQILYAEEKNATTNQQINLGEDPGPVYTDVIRKWAAQTDFAKNAAEMAVGKLKLDMQKDPKLQKVMTPAMIADLQQYFYELFISAETMTNLAKVYSQYFTLDEMNDLIQFYKTPLGQKLVKFNAEITIKTQQIGINLYNNHRKRFMEVIAKHINKPLKAE